MVAKVNKIEASVRLPYVANLIKSVGTQGEAEGAREPRYCT